MGGVFCVVMSLQPAFTFYTYLDKFEGKQTSFLSQTGQVTTARMSMQQKTNTNILSKKSAAVRLKIKPPFSVQKVSLLFFSSIALLVAYTLYKYKLLLYKCGIHLDMQKGRRKSKQKLTPVIHFNSFFNSYFQVIN